MSQNKVGKGVRNVRVGRVVSTAPSRKWRRLMDCNHVREEEKGGGSYTLQSEVKQMLFLQTGKNKLPPRE